MSSSKHTFNLATNFAEYPLIGAHKKKSFRTGQNWSFKATFYFMLHVLYSWNRVLKLLFTTATGCILQANFLSNFFLMFHVKELFWIRKTILPNHKSINGIVTSCVRFGLSWLSTIQNSEAVQSTNSGKCISQIRARIFPKYQGIIMEDVSESMQRMTKQPHCRRTTHNNNRLNGANLSSGPPVGKEPNH